MKKRDKYIYWIATLWLSLGLVSTGIVQLIQMDEEIVRMNQLGFPPYILPLLGVWKLLAVVALLVPRYPLVKEWAYAGIIFNMTGALFAHAISQSPGLDFFGPTLLTVLTILSWYFRSQDRKIA